MDSLSDFLSCCPELIFTAEPDSAVVRLSASLARLVGPELQPGTRIADRVHPDDRRAFDAGWARAIEGEGASRGEAAPPFTFRVLGSDGAYRLVSCRAQISAGSGKCHGALHEAAAEPRGAEPDPSVDLLRAIEDNISIAVWAVNREGTFFHHAGKALEVAGFKQGQFLGMNIFELYAGGEGIRPVEEAFQGKTGHTISKQHDTFWETWYVPVPDASGEITRVAGLTLDVSAITRAERELKEKLTLIERQQQVIRALSTPIIEVWDKVLTIPMMGVVDTTRASDVMESVLKRVVEKRSQFVIFDLTAVDMLDTATADSLLKMIHALRLLGAEGVIVGIQPSVAQTLVTLGVGLENIATRANLEGGLQYVIRRMRGAALRGSPAAP